MSLSRFDLGGCNCPCSVTIHVVCGALDIAGATVTIKQGGITVATGTTGGGGTVTLTIPAPGVSTITADTGGTYPTCTITRNLHCNDTVLIQLCCLVSAAITGCAGETLSGVLVTFTGTSASGSCTTSGGGTCSVTLNCENGPVTVTPSKAGCDFNPPSVSIACGATASFLMGCSHGVKICVHGCQGAAVPGATVTVSGVESWTGTTGSDGCVIFPPKVLGVHSYTVTSPDPSLQGFSGTFTVANLCNLLNINVTLPVTTGYTCSCCNGPWAMSKTLHVTDAGGLHTVVGDGDWTWCSPAVSADHCSAGGPRSLCTCTGPGGPFTFFTAPDDLSTRPTAVLFDLSCNNNGDGTMTWTCTQTTIGDCLGSIPQYLFGGPSPCPAPAPCNPLGSECWLDQVDCTTLLASGGNVTWTGTAVTTGDCHSIGGSISFSGGPWTSTTIGGAFQEPPSASVSWSS